MIKNYTSTVPVERTIYRIEQMLADFGAKAIGKTYGSDKKLETIKFQLTIRGPDGQYTDVLVQLPSNPAKVFEKFKAAKKRLRPGTEEKLKLQAERTAWKLQQDWLELELTQIQLNQKDPLQVFLPYVMIPNTEETFYQRFQASGFSGLLPERTD